MTFLQRVAVIGVGHWHSTYDAAYLELLRGLGVNIVGISDDDAGILRDRAARFKVEPFGDYRTMLERTRTDFVVALGRHVDMPDIFRHLVRVRIPFLMEKPWGV